MTDLHRAPRAPTSSSSASSSTSTSSDSSASSDSLVSIDARICGGDVLRVRRTDRRLFPLSGTWGPQNASKLKIRAKLEPTLSIRLAKLCGLSGSTPDPCFWRLCSLTLAGDPPFTQGGRWGCKWCDRLGRQPYRGVGGTLTCPVSSVLDLLCVDRVVFVICFFSRNFCLHNFN